MDLLRQTLIPLWDQETAYGRSHSATVLVGNWLGAGVVELVLGLLIVWFQYAH